MNRTFILVLIFLNIFFHFRDINERCITIQENMCSSSNIESILYIIFFLLHCSLEYNTDSKCCVLKNKILMDRDWSGITYMSMVTDISRQ